MTATRVSWRFAEITNSFDIDCLPGARRGYHEEGGRPACVSTFPPTPGNREPVVVNSRWPEMELHLPLTPSGREPLPGERLRATIPRLSTGSLIIRYSSGSTPPGFHYEPAITSRLNSQTF